MTEKCGRVLECITTRCTVRTEHRAVNKINQNDHEIIQNAVKSSSKFVKRFLQLFQHVFNDFTKLCDACLRYLWSPFFLNFFLPFHILNSAYVFDMIMKVELIFERH